MALLERLMPKVGDVIRDRYELQSILGEGGFGVVFKARQRGLGKDVAVKVLMPHLLAHDALVQRFEREVSVVKTLNHPNTIRVLDVGVTKNEIPFYVMEFVTGRTLEDVLLEGPISPSRTRRVALQLLKSLAEAHENGVVHRDLKPANVMLCEVFGESDFVKVLDFGIAKAIEEDHGGLVTQTGAILGTPTYLSPEQARGDRQIDVRSDIYAVGLILAECLLGQPFVSGNSTYEIVAMHAKAAPLEVPSSLRGSPFYEIILKATQKDRNERYQSAMEMAEALAGLSGLSDDPIFEATRSGSTPAPLSQHSPARVAFAPTTPDLTGSKTLAEPPEPKRPTALLIALVFALVAVGVAVVLVVQGDGTTTPPAEDAGTTMTTDGQPDGQMNVGDDVGLAEADASTEADAAVALVPTADDDVEEPGADPAIWVEAVDHAHAVIIESMPRDRPLRIEGTQGARVRLGERELGELPLDLELPALDTTVELTFERRGYETRTMVVSLADDLVRVELERRRRADPEDDSSPSDDGNGDDDDETPVQLPFEEAPIYD